MERKLFRYIWSFTRTDQIWIIVVTLLSLVPYYMTFDLPKQIINGPISGIGFEEPGNSLPFMRFEMDLPFLGGITLLPGIELERIPLLFALSFLFLALVIVNGLIKIYINTFKGRLGERLLRRIRFDLIDRILRFPPKRFKSMKAGEVASMVKDEVEPFGGFAGEAFASPVMLTGQALTAMAFIFVQHVGLGLVALVMASVQALVIPKLRARLIVLGRERQLNARQLAGRVTEIVDGIDTIRSSDASNYVRADIVDRLGRIFKIRYDIYQWKFFVKFLNNFIGQLTPFLFYSVGGYLAIMGKLDVGQLVAVINAYKELPGPMKSLIDWDMARQDIQVKYEAVVDQFDVDRMISPQLQAVDTETHLLAGRALQVRGLSIIDDSGTAVLERANTQFEMGETVAFVGSGSSGANALAEAIGRVVWPAEGAVQLGDTDILQLPESIAGRRVTFASADEFFFSGTLRDNLLFRLKNAPRADASYEGEEARLRDWWWEEARLTGNPELDLRADWVDAEAVKAQTGTGSLDEAIGKVLGIVEMEEDILQIALRMQIDEKKDAALSTMLLEVRKAFAVELEARGWQDVVLLFDPAVYNDEATIVENLYYGNPTAEDAVMKLGRSDFMSRIAQETGLGRALYASGCRIAAIAVDLLHDLPPEHPFFDRMKLFAPEELDDYHVALQKVEGLSYDDVPEEFRARFIWLNANYSERWYRFGVLTEELKATIIEARKRVRTGIPNELAGLIEFFDRDSYLYSADIRENIIFGKRNIWMPDADEKILAVGDALRAQFPDIVTQLLNVGMSYDVGPGGRRLSAIQRARLNVARALLRESDIYVFNRPLLGVEDSRQKRIIDATLAFLTARADPPLVIWVLANADRSSAFGRVVTFEAGRLVEGPAGTRAGVTGTGVS